MLACGCRDARRWLRRFGLELVLQFILKVFSRVEVRFFHLNTLHGSARFVHRSIVMLWNRVWFSEGKCYSIQRHSAQLCASHFVVKPSMLIHSPRGNLDSSVNWEETRVYRGRAHKVTTLPLGMMSVVKSAMQVKLNCKVNGYWYSGVLRG